MLFRSPLEILAVGSEGTRRLLELAQQYGARLLLASTSEVYGEPLVHPQVETYWGNVDPIGPRSCYDEAKRFSEALVTAYRTHRGVDTVIIRIFNTYGPRMRPGDTGFDAFLVSQAFMADPYEALRLLREEDPVHWSDALGGWVVTQIGRAHV